MDSQYSFAEGVSPKVVYAIGVPVLGGDLKVGGKATLAGSFGFFFASYFFVVVLMFAALFERWSERILWFGTRCYKGWLVGVLA